MNRTKIEYLDFTWNVTPGCTHGCPWCWARRILKRQKHRCQACYEFRPHLHSERLDDPYRRKKPAKIGVSFTGDLFDPELYDGAADQVLSAMVQAPWHTYIILTKQPQRMVTFFSTRDPWPNWWLLTSITDQADADRRIPELLKLRGAGWTTGVSVEPLLGPVRRRVTQLDWVIIGAQTGPKSRKAKQQWVADLVAECNLGKVPVFVKDNVGWPQTIREFPTHDLA